MTMHKVIGGAAALAIITSIVTAVWFAARRTKNGTPLVKDIATSALLAVVAAGSFAVFTWKLALPLALVSISCVAADVLKRRGILRVE